MRVYLAAAWSRKEEIRKVAEYLIANGIDVQARWLYEPEGGYTAHGKNAFLRERAEIDIEDVHFATVLVRFSDDLSSPTVPAALATGSRMFEMGYAYGNGTDIVVVGGHQCVFDYLDDVTHLKDVEELTDYLRAKARPSDEGLKAHEL